MDNVGVISPVVEDIIISQDTTWPHIKDRSELYGKFKLFSPILLKYCYEQKSLSLFDKMASCCSWGIRYVCSVPSCKREKIRAVYCGNAGLCDVCMEYKGYKEGKKILERINLLAIGVENLKKRGRLYIADTYEGIPFLYVMRPVFTIPKSKWKWLIYKKVPKTKKEIKEDKSDLKASGLLRNAVKDVLLRYYEKELGSKRGELDLTLTCIIHRNSEHLPYDFNWHVEVIMPNLAYDKANNRFVLLNPYPDEAEIKKLWREQLKEYFGWKNLKQVVVNMKYIKHYEKDRLKHSIMYAARCPLVDVLKTLHSVNLGWTKCVVIRYFDKQEGKWIYEKVSLEKYMNLFKVLVPPYQFKRMSSYGIFGRNRKQYFKLMGIEEEEDKKSMWCPEHEIEMDNTHKRVNYREVEDKIRDVESKVSWVGHVNRKRGELLNHVEFRKWRREQAKKIWCDKNDD